MRLTIISTGLENAASIRAALARLEVEAVEANSRDDIARAQRLLLPGVGSFGAAVNVLSSRRFVEPLRERLIARRPTLAICLGFQLLALGSEESPGVPGLGVIEGSVERIVAPRVPQMGWNQVRPDATSDYLQPGYAYFANSFSLRAAPPGWRCAWTEYAGPMVAAVESGPVLACQFHPELSGQWGLGVLRRWMQQEAVPC